MKNTISRLQRENKMFSLVGSYEDLNISSNNSIIMNTSLGVGAIYE